MASAPSTAIRRAKPAELARELGVSRQAIHDLIERGILQKGEDGLVDVEMAKIAIANRVRPSGKTAAALSPTAPPPPTVPGPVAPPAEAHVEAAAATSFHVARTLRETEEARIAKLKRLELERTLIAADPALTAMFTAFRGLRDNSMPIGRRLAGRLASMTDPREIQLLIEDEIRQVFTTFAERTLEQVQARLGRSIDGTQQQA